MVSGRKPNRIAASKALKVHSQFNHGHSTGLYWQRFAEKNGMTRPPMNTIRKPARYAVIQISARALSTRPWYRLRWKQIFKSANQPRNGMNMYMRRLPVLMRTRAISKATADRNRQSTTAANNCTTDGGNNPLK